MKKRKISLLLIMGAFGLLGIAMGTLLLTDTSLIANRVVPQKVTLTPPMSLNELAEIYPDLAEVLQDPELGSVYKEFLVAYQEGGQEAALILAKERGLLTPDEESLQVMLVLDTEENEALQRQLKAQGITIVSAYQDRINIAVPVELITQAMTSGAAGEVLGELTELQHVIAVRLPAKRKTQQQSIFGEGIPVINAAAWHDAGFTGEGIHVGVLDLGFADHEALLGSELPARVEVETFGWYDEEGIHGTACAEIIHEVAPDAQLSFAWYDGSDPALGEAVDWLIEQEVDIISHSAGGIVGPRDGSGWDASLVDSLADQGILWVNSAGNEALSHYRATFTDQDGDSWHEFAPKEELLAIYGEEYLEIYLLWDDVWTAAIEDYELHVVNADGETIATSEDTQNGIAGQEPVEWVEISMDTSVVYAMVMAYDTDRAATFDLFAYGPYAEVPQAVPAYSVLTPADAVHALTVGAVDWDDDWIAPYSSQGPTNDERLKPEISAPTGVSGVTYGDYGFDGTSASAPHVAGAAALAWEAHPEFQHRDIFEYLISATQDLGPSGPDTVYGYGHLALPAPPVALLATPTATVSPTPVATTELGATATPVPATATRAPLPTATAVSFTTPTPPTTSRDGALAFGLTTFGLVIGGMGIGGLGLLVGGGILLFAARSAPTPSPGANAQPKFQQARPMPSPPPSYTKQHMPQPRPPRRDLSRCPSCGASVRTGAKFCPKCGQALLGSRATTVKAKPASKYCRYCGAPLRPNSKFCSKCGKKLKGR